MLTEVYIFDHYDLPDPEFFLHGYLANEFSNDCLKRVYVEKLEDDEKMMELWNWLDEKGVPGEEKKCLVDISW